MDPVAEARLRIEITDEQLRGRPEVTWVRTPRNNNSIETEDDDSTMTDSDGTHKVPTFSGKMMTILCGG